jgi:hypothetical protein
LKRWTKKDILAFQKGWQNLWCCSGRHNQSFYL